MCPCGAQEIVTGLPLPKQCKPRAEQCSKHACWLWSCGGILFDELFKDTWLVVIPLVWCTPYIRLSWMLASNDAGGLSILGSTVLVSSMYWFCKFTRRLWRLWNCRRLSSVLLTEALFAWGREKLVKTQRSASQGFSNMHCALKACFERYGRTVRIETSIFGTGREMPETQNDALCSEHIVNACMVSAGIIERKLKRTKVRLFTVPCCSIILFSSEGVKKKCIWSSS